MSRKTVTRDTALEEAYERLALKGNLLAAAELAVLEAPYAVTTNLDACPEAAWEYEESRMDALECEFEGVAT